MQNCMGKPLETGDVWRLALTTTRQGGPRVRPLRADPSLVFLAWDVLLRLIIKAINFVT